MPDRHIRALRKQLEALLQSTRKLEHEIADALKARDASRQEPTVDRRVAKKPRRKRRSKAYRQA